MQFKSIVSTSALIASVLAAPAPAPSPAGLDIISGVTSAVGSVASSVSSAVSGLTGPLIAHGTIECSQDTSICTTSCGEDLQAVCDLVGAFDSFFYGLELFVGFQIDCTEKGCKVTCPTDGTAVCTLDNVGAVFDSIFVVGEGIVIDGVEEIIASLTGGDISSQLIPPNVVEKAIPGASSIFK